MPETAPSLSTPEARRHDAAAPIRLALRSGHSLRLEPGKPLLVGVVNVTPDSFSDGGRFFDPERAIDHALRLVEEGADLLDLGAESTRPGGGVYGEGAQLVPADEEIERLLPVLVPLRDRTDRPISIDTRKAAVAEKALAAGGDLVNDVSALGDPAMADVVRRANCPVVLMHARGDLRSMQREIAFENVVREVRDELSSAADRALAAGIGRDRIVLDPGLGFGKRSEQSLALLRALPELASLGFPLFVGASRKSFLGTIGGAAAADRLPESLAAAAVAARGGASFLRVHDVGETRRFLRCLDRFERPEGSDEAAFR